MQKLWNENELINVNGRYFLNYEASKRFYQIYKDRLDKKYADNRFELEWVKKVLELYPIMEEKKEIIETDEEKIKKLYKEKYPIANKNINILFYFLYSLSSELGRELDIDELKKYGRLLIEDFNYAEYYFELYFEIMKNKFSNVLKNKCRDLNELLSMLNIGKICLDNSMDIDEIYICKWLKENLYFSQEKILEFTDFINKLKEYSNRYYCAEEIVKYLDDKYDLYSLFHYDISLEDQDKIIKNYDNDYNYLFKIPGILNKNDGMEIDELSKYFDLLYKKCNLDYDRDALKFIIKLPYEQLPLDLDNFIDEANSLYDLLKLLEIPVKYDIDTKELNLNKIDEWLYNKGFYAPEKINVLKTKFIDELKENPYNYYFSQNLIAHIESMLTTDNNVKKKQKLY